MVKFLHDSFRLIFVVYWFHLNNIYNSKYQHPTWSLAHNQDVRFCLSKAFEICRAATVPLSFFLHNIGHQVYVNAIYLSMTPFQRTISLFSLWAIMHIVYIHSVVSFFVRFSTLHDITIKVGLIQTSITIFDKPCDPQSIQLILLLSCFPVMSAFSLFHLID